jgi:predicted amidohydrolase YtcJ
VTGKTVAGFRLYPQRNCLDRETALRMWTENVTWFSGEEGKKGKIAVGQFADLIVPDRLRLRTAHLPRHSHHWRSR